MGSNLSSAVLRRDLDIATVLFNLESLLDTWITETTLAYNVDAVSWDRFLTPKIELYIKSDRKIRTFWTKNLEELCFYFGCFWVEQRKKQELK